MFVIETNTLNVAKRKFMMDRSIYSFLLMILVVGAMWTTACQRPNDNKALANLNKNRGTDTLTTSNKEYVSDMDTLTTQDKERKSIREHLEKHLFSVSRLENKVHFVADGNLSLDALSEQTMFLPITFALGISETFFLRSERYSACEFNILRIKEDRVVLNYRAEFDHKSSGEHLISIDKGTIELGYFDQ